MARATNDRLAAVCAVLFALLGLLWLRCVHLQVVSAPRLSKLARMQHWTSRSILPERGTISDRNGQVLAMGTRVPSVFANARRVANKDETARRVAKLLGRDVGYVKKRLSRDKGFVWVARQVDPEVEQELGAFRREGIGTVEEAKRVYPQGRLASHVVGFVDIDQRGLEGLELAFNGMLRGRPGWISTLRDAKGDLLMGPWTVDAPPVDGCDLTLTIDSVVQAAAEDALAWGMKKFKAKGGAVVIMEPSTGQLLAMANQPDFDPNHPGRYKTETRRLRSITDLAEPGSIFKIVTAAALLEEGAVRLDERIFCEEGSYRTVGRHILHDHHPNGWLTFHQVIAKSSNIGTAKAAQRLSPETLYRYIRAFGVGQKTGIELRGEISGMIAPPTRWSKLSPFIIPIGQEVALTPIQVAAMVSIIANGGWQVKPYVVMRVDGPDGRPLREFASRRGERILSPTTIDGLNLMLTSVVESGTGQLAKVQGLTVAGKTGTAQKLEPDGRYSHSRFVASFVGYGPVPDPRFVIAVMIDEPRPLYFGGVVAAPIFKRVVEQLASYWQLKPPASPTLIAKQS